LQKGVPAGICQIALMDESGMIRTQRMHNRSENVTVRGTLCMIPPCKSNQQPIQLFLCAEITGWAFLASRATRQNQRRPPWRPSSSENIPTPHHAYLFNDQYSIVSTGFRVNMKQDTLKEILLLWI
jgi:hypothetical protein